ncbi:MAG: hypothetical protein KDD69_06265 [Bdellovibrionales bacterium]|nr:hypothetical protein [Bdellovibrionales bacterium]
MVSEKPYLAGYIPTAAHSGELSAQGLAHFLMPQWRRDVAEAVGRNGGTGNAREGYLAWSELGFARLRNPNLTGEQNRRLAEISLRYGIPVEKLPARCEYEVRTSERHNQWVNRVIDRFDSELREFLANPLDELRVNDGKRRFRFSFDKETGVPRVLYYKKKSGLGGMFDAAVRTATQILQVADPLALGVSLARRSERLAGPARLLGAAGASSGLLTELRRVAERVDQGSFTARDAILLAGSEAGRALQLVPGAGAFATAFDLAFAYARARLGSRSTSR